MGCRKGLNWYSQYCYDTRHGNRFIEELDTNQLKRRHPLGERSDHLRLSHLFIRCAPCCGSSGPKIEVMQSLLRAYALTIQD